MDPGQMNARPGRWQHSKASAVQVEQRIRQSVLDAAERGKN